jgi:hypothetical protein
LTKRENKVNIEIDISSLKSTEKRDYMEKKTWIEPELIVLVRSKPEEAVLYACKVWNGSGPNYYDFQCNHPASCGLGCISQVGT